jgi:hypothetical protein
VNEAGVKYNEQPQSTPQQVTQVRPEIPEPNGSLIVLTMQHRIGFGAFADVFRNPHNGRVYKVFRKQQQNDSLNDDLGEYQPILRRTVFNAEKAAYEIAANNHAIRPFVPTFHGVIEIGQVMDSDGNDISERYLLDCCYVVDFVDGEVTDLTQNLVNQHAHLRFLTESLALTGINHWRDGAVFHPSDPDRTKIIDFATKDAYYEGELAMVTAE